jgi:hypothetical protein
VISTLGPNATFDGHDPSEAVLTRLAAALAPGRPLRLPGSA